MKCLFHPLLGKQGLDKAHDHRLVLWVEMIPPFSSRMRANLGAYHVQGDWVRDRVDFYVQRDRDKLVRQLVQQLKLPRPQAEQQVSKLLHEAEKWVNERRKPSPEEAASQEREMTEQEKEEALSFLRHPELARQVLSDMEKLGYIGEENPKLLAY